MNRIPIVVFVVMVLLLLVVPVNAAGATQVSGIGRFADEGECTDPEGAGSDFASVLEGDLDGCVYVTVETWSCTPSGVYLETGTEIFVVESSDGRSGTFSTTYRFSAKFEDCAGLTGQIFGRCQHPIVAGSGTEDFEGVTGRIDFKDDVAAGNFPYTGHLSS